LRQLGYLMLGLRELVLSKQALALVRQHGSLSIMKLKGEAIDLRLQLPDLEVLTQKKKLNLQCPSIYTMYRHYIEDF
jgi:hypothetical protein